MSAATDAEASWRENSDNQTRLAFGQALLEIGARESRSVVLSADTQDLLGIRPWIERFPDRFIDVGICEQHAVGMAAGLTREGHMPVVAIRHATSRSRRRRSRPCLKVPRWRPYLPIQVLQISPQRCRFQKRPKQRLTLSRNLQ